MAFRYLSGEHLDEDLLMAEAMAERAPLMQHMQLRPTDGSAETALLQDGRSGFTQSIPGHPRLLTQGDGAADESNDASIIIGDLPIVVTFQLEHVGALANSQALAQVMLQSAAAEVTQAPIRIHDFTTTQRQRFGVAGAVRALFSRRHADTHDTEAHLVVLQSTFALHATCQFRRDDIHWLNWAFFESAFVNAIQWGADVNEARNLWPKSPFVKAGINAPATDEGQALIERMAVDLLAVDQIAGASATRHRELLRRLRLCAVDLRPPWHTFGKKTRQALTRYLTDPVSSPSLAFEIREHMQRVNHMQDLRGLIALISRAFDQVNAWQQGQAS